MRAREHRPARIGAPLLRVAACASLIAIAGSLGRALAEDADPGPAPTVTTRSWTTRALTIGFSDAFLGVPKNELRDDNGFVANLRVTAELPSGERGMLRLGASQQLITERGGLNRVDEGKVYATWRRWLGPSPAKGLTLGWTLGVHVVGNLGGSVMQDWAHRTLFAGRLLSGQGTNELQYRYPDGYDVLGTVGGLARLVHPLGGPWSLSGGFEGGLGVGTGVFGELHPYVALGLATPLVELEFRGAAGIYGTDIRPLTMRGGYVKGVLQSQPSAHLSVLGPPWFPTLLTFDLEWNRGDSGQHVGGITVGGRF